MQWYRLTLGYTSTVGSDRNCITNRNEGLRSRTENPQWMRSSPCQQRIRIRSDHIFSKMSWRTQEHRKLSRSPLSSSKVDPCHKYNRSLRSSTNAYARTLCIWKSSSGSVLPRSRRVQDLTWRQRGMGLIYVPACINGYNEGREKTYAASAGLFPIFEQRAKRQEWWS